MSSKSYPCYDCGSTIPRHHTPHCEMAPKSAIHDLPEEEGTQFWTGRDQPTRRLRRDMTPTQEVVALHLYNSGGATELSTPFGTFSGATLGFDYEEDVLPVNKRTIEAMFRNGWLLRGDHEDNTQFYVLTEKGVARMETLT